MNQVEYLEPSLAQVIERIGADYVTVVAAPHGVDVPISGPAIHDPLSAAPPKPGAMVLLVGLTPETPGAAQTIRRLAGAAAAVLRSDAVGAASLVEAAAEAGVALIALRVAMSWSHLHTLLEDAVLPGDSLVAAASRDLGSVPAGDLNALVNAIAETLDRPAGIVDTQWRLLAYSAIPGQTNDDLQRDVILSRTVPARNAPQETRRLLLTSHRALRFHTGPPYDDDGHRIWRIGAGIRGGPEPLGMLWVLEGDERLSEDKLVLVEEFARLAAAHLLRARRARTVDRERRGELVGQALDGRDPRTACHRLGLDPGAGIAVLAVAELVAGDVPLGEHLLDAVATYLDAYRRSTACVLRGDTVYCLMPAQDLAALREVASDLTRRLGLRRRLVASVGGRVGADDLPRSRRQADLALAVLRASGTAVATIDEVRAAAALIELRSLLDDHPDLLLHEVDPALRDAEESALAWIECHGDVRAAAQRLRVHPNTLRYRIRRLAGNGLDLTDPGTRLITWLRLRLRDGEPGSSAQA
ncbi:PucR family transcriptional regulator [Microtetraspora fusca]|uniref:PucR family transcriptional regulator n=1 Tax=Microtetraspora fusca TaxID=1997 RepID=UPI00083026C9|nr:helix-turn-helix domain-containing protein [Microtetraspora fusca]